MPFAYDYSAVGRWVLEQGLDAVTIEPSGRVVFSCFDIDPAMFVGVIWHEATFEEVADGPPRPGCEARWAAAGAHLRSLRVPGQTSCIVVSLVGSASPRAFVVPYTWTLDGAPVSAPHLPGPHVGFFEERPAMVAGGAPFVIAAQPGAHRLEGTVRFLVDGVVAREVPVALEVTLRAGEDTAVELLANDEPVAATLRAVEAERASPAAPPTYAELSARAEQRFTLWGPNSGGGAFVLLVDGVLYEVAYGDETRLPGGAETVVASYSRADFLRLFAGYADRRREIVAFLRSQGAARSDE